MKEFESFIKKHPSKTYEPGEMIMHQDEPCNSAYVITSGLIKTYDINKEGEIKPLSYDGIHQVFPMATIFSFSKLTLYYFEAFLRTTLSIIPKDEFVNFIESHPESLAYVHRILVKAYIDSRSRINSLSQIRSEEKILYGLQFFCKRYAKPIGNQKVKMTIPLSQQELANFLGLTRETVSTSMNILRKRKIVDYKSMDEITVNTNKIIDELS